MSLRQNPPPVIAGLYVVAFAHADSSVRFEQRHTLNVGGKWLGRVPCLALCLSFEKAEFMIQYCSKQWNPLGIAGGYKSINEAKQRIERSYHGITPKWRKQSVPKKVAFAAYKAKLKAEGCSFCGRTFREVTAMMGRNTRICNHCVDTFYEAIHNQSKPSAHPPALS